tara:strand:+ start:513 stop:1046 length:534 start_codon:yes stop_codon:yes gene_type:complete
MAITRLGGANAISGIIPVANGGTGASSFSPGKILQIVEGTSSTQHEATGSADQDIGLSVAITPSSSSNKVLVTVSFDYSIFQSGQYGSSAQFALLRDSSAIIARSGGTNQDYNVEASALSTSNYVTMATQLNMQILDSPSTTSATTYKVQSTGVSSTRVRCMLNNVRGSIVAYEVGA